MKHISFKLSNGEMTTETIYHCNDFPYDQLTEYTTCSKNRISYINQLAAFDIEAYTIPSDNPYAYMYIWQFCIENMVCMGRTWSEFLTFIDRLSTTVSCNTKNRLVVWVHSLPYEFQFIRRFFDWENVFAKDTRDVLRALTTSGIEFRCSYALTNKSLEKMQLSARSHLYLKQSGRKYNYKKFRTPSTKMADYELAYCYCDVRGLCEALEDFLEKDTLATIPMTSTGYVRRDCRNAMRKNPKNREIFKKCRITKEVYQLLEEAKRGGNTHANRHIVGRILHNVHCVDISSSYPYAMMVKYYPLSCFFKMDVTDRNSFNAYLNEYCCLFRIAFKNIRIKENVPIPYISYSKCNEYGENDIVFNGRLLSAEYVSTTLTEIDYNIICEQYDFDDIAISDFHCAVRGQLPDELRERIIYYYVNKTKLKGIDDYEYAKSKELLNAIFGMMCTNPVHDVIYIDDEGEWHHDKGDIKEELNRYYKSRNSFLSPAWGVWVTAHARAWLQKAIDITSDNTCYVDTDSDKFQAMDENIFNELNSEAIELSKKAGAYAMDPDGNIHYMGVFEIEKPYDRFRTWGAKKYVYEQKNKKGKKELHITIAGVNKKMGAEYLIKHGGIDKFNIQYKNGKREGFYFPPGHSGRTTAWHNDDGIHTIVVNGKPILTAANTGILETGYQLGITDTFCENMDMTLDIFDDYV